MLFIRLLAAHTPTPTRPVVSLVALFLAFISRKYYHNFIIHKVNSQVLVLGSHPKQISTIGDGFIGICEGIKLWSSFDASCTWPFVSCGHCCWCEWRWWFHGHWWAQFKSSMFFFHCCVWDMKCPTSHFPGYVAWRRGEEFVKRGCGWREEKR